MNIAVIGSLRSWQEWRHANSLWTKDKGTPGSKSFKCGDLNYRHVGCDDDVVGVVWNGLIELWDAFSCHIDAPFRMANGEDRR